MPDPSSRKQWRSRGGGLSGIRDARCLSHRTDAAVEVERRSKNPQMKQLDAVEQLARAAACPAASPLAKEKPK